MFVMEQKAMHEDEDEGRGRKKPAGPFFAGVAGSTALTLTHAHIKSRQRILIAEDVALHLFFLFHFPLLLSKCPVTSIPSFLYTPDGNGVVLIFIFFWQVA